MSGDEKLNLFFGFESRVCYVSAMHDFCLVIIIFLTPNYSVGVFNNFW